MDWWWPVASVGRMAAPWRAAWPWAVLVAVSVAAVTTTARAKECTNIPTELSSHTVRARLQASPGEGAAEWRWRELFHEHLNPTDEAAWMDLMPPPRQGSLRASAAGHHHQHREEELGDWVMLYRSLKGQLVGGTAMPASASDAAAGAGPPFLEEVSLHDVRLDPDGDAAYGRAQRTNLEYLLLLDVDRSGASAPRRGCRRRASPTAAGRSLTASSGATSSVRTRTRSLCARSLSQPCPCIDRRPTHAHAEMLRRHVPGRTRPLLCAITWWCSGRTPAKQIIHGFFP